MNEMSDIIILKSVKQKIKADYKKVKELYGDNNMLSKGYIRSIMIIDEETKILNRKLNCL